MPHIDLFINEFADFYKELLKPEADAESKKYFEGSGLVSHKRDMVVEYYEVQQIELL